MLSPWIHYFWTTHPKLRQRNERQALALARQHVAEQEVAEHVEAALDLGVVEEAAAEEAATEGAEGE